MDFLFVSKRERRKERATNEDVGALLRRQRELTDLIAQHTEALQEVNDKLCLALGRMISSASSGTKPARAEVFAPFRVCTLHVEPVKNWSKVQDYISEQLQGRIVWVGADEPCDLTLITCEVGSRGFAASVDGYPDPLVTAQLERIRAWRSSHDTAPALVIVAVVGLPEEELRVAVKVEGLATVKVQRTFDGMAVVDTFGMVVGRVREIQEHKIKTGPN